MSHLKKGLLSAVLFAGAVAAGVLSQPGEVGAFRPRGHCLRCYSYDRCSTSTTGGDECQVQDDFCIEWGDCVSD